MDTNSLNKCGCKGIRTCLICEKEKGTNWKTSLRKQDAALYTYCPHCNLCWPENNTSNGTTDEPLYLGNIKLVLDFLNQDEEEMAIDGIDQIPWMPSQSGRKKQDFGPKVNFKKRKGKVGDFRGFPHFSKSFIHKFQQHRELSDFSPVELCHLEYSPDRGSAIEPHIDDSWIWGERLVTINLSSPTVLTLTPANAQTCSCSDPIANHSGFVDSCACDHHELPSPCEQSDSPDGLTTDFDSRFSRGMCDRHRTSGGVSASVRVLLPARSLLLLAGCARHNWFHEIKREDVSSRRLAMTFRELSTEFVANEGGRKLGEELLEIGKTFCDF